MTKRRTNEVYPRSETRMRLWMPADGDERGRYTWRPPTNVYETEGGVIVQLEVAGLGAGDFHVTLVDDKLTVAGIRREAAAFAFVTCQQMEIATGRFRSEVHLGWSVDDEEIRVDYRDGFLTVFLPRQSAHLEAEGDRDEEEAHDG